MTNDFDPIDQLWQQQPTANINAGQIKTRWSRLRLSQIIYLLLDVLVVVVTTILLIVFFERFSPITQIMLVLFWLFGVLFTAYISWLRRDAILTSNHDTGLHLQSLKKQLANNIRISQFSKQVCWIVLIFDYLLIVLDGWFTDASLADTTGKLIRLTLVLGLILPPLWIWFDRRQKRFAKELINLQQWG